MTLLDRYLKAVAAQLPKDTREDIIAELRDVLLNRFEAREEELGLPLTEDEQEAIIREMGHPLTVAGRYRNGPSHLIGPEIYPYWLFAVKVGLAAMALITIVAAIIQLMVGEIGAAQWVGKIINGVIGGGITLIGVATIAGFILERQATKPKFMTEWRVKDLAVFELGSLDAEALERQFGGATPFKIRRRSAWRRDGSLVGNALASATVTLVVMLWWTGLLPIADLRPGAGAVVIGGVDYGAILTSIVEIAFWPILAYLTARIVFELFRAWRPSALRRAALGNFGLAALRLAGAWWLWTISPLAPLIYVDSLQGVVDAARSLTSGNISVAAILTLCVVFTMVEAIWTMVASLWALVLPGAGRKAESVV